MDNDFNSEANSFCASAPTFELGDGTMTQPNSDKNLRCECGKLIARWTPNGCELKCARCKAVWRLPWGAGEAMLVAVPSPLGGSKGKI